MILTLRSRTLLSAAGISMVLLILSAGAGMTQDQQQTNSCPCCKKMMDQGSRT